MPGRPRKPRQTKIIQGTFQKCRNPEHEPEPEKIVASAIPEPPAGLGKWGRSWWKQICYELTTLGILTKVDIPILQSAAEAWEIMRDCWDIIYRDSDSGKLRPLSDYMEERKFSRKLMPELVSYENSTTRYVALCNQLGLSPVARNKISVSEPPKDVDPMEALLEHNA